MSEEQDRTLGIGVLGVGQRGRKHLELVRAVPAARLVAVADSHGPSLELARPLLDPETRVYGHWSELLADEAVEAVILALPNDLHTEATLDVLRARKHLLLEKPVALTSADCRRVREAARAVPVVVQVGLELRYATVVRRMQEEIATGRIGRPVMAWCHEFRRPFAAGKVGDWIHDPRRSGGTFIEKNCHHFDLLNLFLGAEPIRVAAFGGGDVVYRDRPGLLDAAWAIVEYAGGRRAALGDSMFSAARKLELGVLGDEGLVEGDLVARRITLSAAGGAPATVAVPDPAAARVAAHGGADLLQLEDFARTVLRGDAPRVTLEDGIRSLLPALAARRAVETGASVTIAEIAGEAPVGDGARRGG